MMNKLKNTCFYSFLLLAIISLASCAENPNSEVNERLEAERDSLAQQLQAQRQTSDSLLENLQLHQTEQDDPILFGRDFRDIENPEEFISANLREQPELIPLEAVLGGSMAYRRIEVLNEKWVMATYDDGHIQGQAIYQYRFASEDSLEFILRLYNHP